MLRMKPAEPIDKPIGYEDLQNLVGELRMMARGLLRSESNAYSVTPTALAMSALLRAKAASEDWENVRWENRAHFFSALARAMRRALIDHARRRIARGRSNIRPCAPDDAALLNLPAEAEARPEGVLMLEEALERLENEDAQLADLVKLHYFAGYSSVEIARFLGINEKTVDRHLNRARVLLRSLMRG